MFDNIKEKVVESIADRFLKNSGILDVIDHPEDYKIEVGCKETYNEIITIRVMKKELY